MKFSEYRDRVYGCWLGKCICGSIGAPLEGCKQLFEYKFDPEFWKISLPNDDLELQVLWLNVIEKLGLDLDADDFAEAFVAAVPYNPGEYAYFKRNFRRGIHPPTSGTYNNYYYHQGMGCCIRAEIWACLCAGDPQLAARVCQLDGQIDHSAESIYSEMFIAALEAAAFVEQDLDKLLDIAVGVIPADSKLARLVADTRRWCRMFDDIRYIRDEILRHYGHPDCTNMFENIGITIMSLLGSNLNLEKATMFALNSGFDTDCTCGIAGAIVGIIKGAKRLQREFGVKDTGYTANFELNRPSDRIEQLADDIARLSSEVERQWKRKLVLEDVPPEVANFRLPVRVRTCTFTVKYDGEPVIFPGGVAYCELTIRNHTDKPLSGPLVLTAPDSLSIDCPKQLTIGAQCQKTVNVIVRHQTPQAIADKQLINVKFADCEYTFGFAAAVPWKVYGPYWENFYTIPQAGLNDGHYSRFIQPGKFPNMSSAVRNYHLNLRAGLDIVGLDEEALAKSYCGRENTVIYATNDLIPIDNAFGYQGPAVFYLAMEFTTPIDLPVTFSVGHTGPFVLWIDGVEKVRSEDETWLTPENINLDRINLPAGKHRAVFKVVRQGRSVDLCLIVRAPSRRGERGDAHATQLTFLNE